MKTLLIQCLCAFLFFPMAGIAGEGNLDKESAEALSQTKALLNDTAFHNGYMADPKAQEAHQKVKDLTGGNQRQQQEIYSISAESFDAIVIQANGDPAKIQEILLKAQADPKGFLQSLPPEQRDRIRALASEMEKKPSP